MILVGTPKEMKAGYLFKVTPSGKHILIGFTSRGDFWLRSIHDNSSETKPILAHIDRRV